MRAGLRIGPVPADADRSVVVLAMIETHDGLANVEEICAVEGLDGIYVGPYDLRLALGGAYPTDPSLDEAFDEAVERINRAAQQAGDLRRLPHLRRHRGRDAPGAGVHPGDGLLRPDPPRAGRRGHLRAARPPR